MSETNPTLGEQRVRVDFNPAGDANVTEFKSKIAELIDLVEMIKGFDPRLAAMAQSSLEIACMWAVKLATTPAISAEAKPLEVSGTENVKTNEG